MYKHQSGIGSTYGHCIYTTMPESVRVEGCIVQDGVRGGGNGAILFSEGAEKSKAWHLTFYLSVEI